MIQAALEWHKRPTAFMMRDEWFGHRDPFNGEPYGDKDEWLDWDFALATAYQTVEAYTDKNGIPEWRKQDPDVVIDAERRIDQFQEAIDIMKSGTNYKPKPGEYFVPAFTFRRKDRSMWTYEDWRKDEYEKMVAKAEKG